MVAAAEIVKVLPPDPGDLILVGEKFAVSPDGWPETVRFTADLKAEVIVVVAVTVALLPTRIVAEPVDVANVKVAGTETTRLVAAVFAVPLEAAVTVTGYVPAFALDVAANVSVDVPEPGAGKMPGLKPAVTPAGRPPTVNAT